jgi:hypothetical protein
VVGAADFGHLQRRPVGSGRPLEPVIQGCVETAVDRKLGDAVELVDLLVVNVAGEPGAHVVGLQDLEDALLIADVVVVEADGEVAHHHDRLIVRGLIQLVEQPLHPVLAESAAFLQQVAGVECDEPDTGGVERIPALPEQFAVTLTGRGVPAPIVIARDVVDSGEEIVRDGAEVGVVLFDGPVVHDVADMADGRGIPGQDVLVHPPGPSGALRDRDADVGIAQEGESFRWWLGRRRAPKGHRPQSGGADRPRGQGEELTTA